MAIKKSFNGASIRRPGSYSKTQTSPDGGTQSAELGVLFLIGEADAGPSGAEEGMQEYSAVAFNQLKAKYRSGPLVDVAKAALVPSRTPGVNGASKFVVWKTNPSVQASLVLGNSYATAKALEYGVGGNRITYKNELSSEGAISVTGTAAVTAFVSLNTQTIVIRQNGGSATTVTFSSPADIAAVVSQFNGAVTGVTASNASGALKLTMDASANSHRTGVARSFEIASGSALGNLFLTAGLVTATDEIEASFEILQPRDLATETAVVGGDIAISLGRSNAGSCTAATVAVSATEMTLTQTGATPSSYVLSFEDYPLLGNLSDAIGNLSGWTVSVPSTLRNVPSVSLDHVSATGAFATVASITPCRIKRDANAVSEFIATSNLIEFESQATKGLPDAEGRLNLAGGVRGASSSSNFDAGFSAALAFDWNVGVPCISQDASADITAGLTDASSTYDVETVIAMLSTHLSLRGQVKNRKEAQGVCGFRTATKAVAFEQAASLGSSVLQMCMEDVYVVDSSNELKWKQPHVLAALVAGMRLGTEIGEPLTHKVLNVQGVGHYVNVSTGAVGGDYNPLLDYDAAIDAGVTSAEPANGGWRIMVDNTTYGADENFVFNRGSVVEAAQHIAKTLRSDSEAFVVGTKTAVITESSVKSRVRAKLIELFDDKITTGDSEAPQGFIEESLIVTRNGNTTEIAVEVKPVQGNDFVFITFTLGDTSQTA